MVNKCVVYGCKSGYKQLQENVQSFRFPANERVYLKNGLVLSIVPIGNHCKFGFCAKHFLDKFIRDGLRKTLNWSLNPIPTLHTQIALKRPSTLKTPSAV